uniref:Secreted protein n=1 Tax=Heterorhabditis bacteriophora TaxID=37862 RepID=A0A1I7XLN2_HETBA
MVYTLFIRFLSAMHGLVNSQSYSIQTSEDDYFVNLTDDLRDIKILRIKTNYLFDWKRSGSQWTYESNAGKIAAFHPRSSK